MRLGWGELDDLAQLALPTLVMHGAADRVLSVAPAEAFAHGISDSQIVIVDDMGHLPTRAEWIDLARTSAKFLGDTTR